MCEHGGNDQTKKEKKNKEKTYEMTKQSKTNKENLWLSDELCSTCSPKTEIKGFVDKPLPFHQNGTFRSEENVMFYKKISITVDSHMYL